MALSKTIVALVVIVGNFVLGMAAGVFLATSVEAGVNQGRATCGVSDNDSQTFKHAPVHRGGAKEY